jgi:hypothetical protein
VRQGADSSPSTRATAPEGKLASFLDLVFAEPYDNLVPPRILNVKGDSMSEVNKAIVRRLA